MYFVFWDENEILEGDMWNVIWSSFGREGDVN